MLVSGFYSMIGRVVNRVIRLDPFASEKLRKLNGSIIGIESLGLRINIHVQDGQLQLRPAGEQADVTISGPPISLLAAFFQQQTPDALEIEGRVGIAQQLFVLLKELDLDWEEQCARLIGDIPAHQLFMLIKHSNRKLSQHRETFMLQFQEWMRESVHGVPYRFEVNDFNRNVSLLRADGDRLEKRIQRLKKRLQELTG